jgi:hypothetical protein
MASTLRLLAAIVGLTLGAGVEGCGRTDLFSAIGIAGNSNNNHYDAGAGASDHFVCPTGSREICGDGIDNDCNGLTDCADPACFGAPACSKPGQEICNNGIDDNGDGLVDCADPECVGSPACRPGMGKEICDNGIDDNGDGLVDCADPMCSTTFPGCLTVNCMPDVDFGTLAPHGARATQMLDTTGATASYATCAPAGGHGRVGRFTLTAAADVRLDFSQASTAAHVVALFRAGALQSCDRNPVDCVPIGQAATATHTFAALAPGVYWLIVESYPGTQGATTVTLSTGNASTPEICNNGIDDDGNGLIDCADLACLNAPSCVASECMPDAKLGALVVGAPAKTVSFDLRTQPDRYRPTCSGTSPGDDAAVSFTLPEAGGVDVTYTESGQTVFGMFFAPGPGLACDANQHACTLSESSSGAIAFSNLPAGNYVLIVKAAGPAQAGPITLSFTSFASRMVEICNNGIDDDGNGLVDCADPACFGIGTCGASGCTPGQNLGSLGPGTVAQAVVDTSTGNSLYPTSCSRGNGKEQVLRLTLTEPMGLTLECTDTGSNVFELSQQIAPLDACNANDVNCGDPGVLPFGCAYTIPGLQPGTYNLIVQAFQSGDEGIVNLTLIGQQETVTEICNNGIDDDGDGAIDCADLKCVTSPECAKFACRADQSIGLLPLDGSAHSTVVQTTMAGDDQMKTPCVSAPGGQDADVDFQLPAPANLTLEWAQVGNHDFAIYPDGGMLLACDAEPDATCVPSQAQSTGSFVTALPAGRYHLVVDADRPGSEGGVVLQLSATPQ